MYDFYTKPIILCGIGVAIPNNWYDNLGLKSREELMVTRKKVLIIDDEVDLCLLMKTYFLRKNYEVYIAHTLSDGVSRIREITPDYLFIDYNLPDGLGWDKLPDLYRQYPDIQFHLISAFRPTMPTELDRAKLTIWEKPISLKSLDNFF